LPGYEGDAWVGLLAPTGTPAGAISKINAEVSKMQKDPEFLAKLALAGLSPVEMAIDEFGAFLKADVARWKKVIEVSGTTIQQ
jgi:tripartite-type tricarboxylate transporter receptor subunit TctC